MMEVSTTTDRDRTVPDRTMTDGQVAFKLLASNAKKAKSRCQCFNVEPGSQKFKEAISNLALKIEVNETFLAMMLTAMINGNGKEKELYTYARALCEEASLKLVDIHLLYHKRTSIAELPGILGEEAALTKISKERLSLFIVRRLNYLQRRILLENKMERDFPYTM